MNYAMSIRRNFRTVTSRLTLFRTVDMPKCVCHYCINSSVYVTIASMYKCVCHVTIASFTCAIPAHLKSIYY